MVFFIYSIAATPGLNALVLRNGSTLDALFVLLKATLICITIVILMIKKKIFK